MPWGLHLLAQTLSVCIPPACWSDEWSPFPEKSDLKYLLPVLFFDAHISSYRMHTVRSTQGIYDPGLHHSRCTTLLDLSWCIAPALK